MASAKMIRFTCGRNQPPVYVNAVRIQSMREGKTDAEGPTTKITMTGAIFDYIVVDGLVAENAKRVNDDEDG
jgi:hypothetical protein